MNKLTKFGIAALLALGAIRGNAATTNYWVQNVNLKLSAYVQVKSDVLRGTLPTKQFLAFLSGITNPALINGQTVVQSTNPTYPYITIEVTNSPYLPITASPPDDLPRGYTLTTDYVVSPDDGVTLYTNNVNFNAPVTYSFQNAVTVPTNRTAYLFPQLPAASVTAVWTNHGPGVVFALSGYITSNTVSTVTNYVHGTNPDFTRQPGAKLLFITPYVGGTNYPSKYVVRYRNGRQNVDVDVSSFISEAYGSPFTTVSQQLYAGGPLRIYAFSGIDFNNGAGTSLSFLGFDTQTWSRPPAKSASLAGTILKGRTIDVANYSGFISGHIQDKTFNYSPVVVRGSVTFSNGKFE
jgi:hypothetical protein